MGSMEEQVNPDVCWDRQTSAMILTAIPKQILGGEIKVTGPSHSLVPVTLH